MQQGILVVNQISQDRYIENQQAAEVSDLVGECRLGGGGLRDGFFGVDGVSGGEGLAIRKSGAFGGEQALGSCRILDI